jgi:hypothetical protein
LKFAVNIPDGCSDLTRNLASLGKISNGIVLTSQGEELAEAINQTRFGRELWKPLALIFIVLLVSESLVGRAWRTDS